MNKYSSLFKKNMTSKQIALKYFDISGSYNGEDKKMLDEAFDEAFKNAQHKELEYASANSGEGYAYCAN